MAPKDRVSIDQKSATSTIWAPEDHEEEVCRRVVYGNTRSRIYYLPTCRLLRPLNSRLVIFNTSGDAEKAGYRLCYHCKSSSSRNRDQVAAAGVMCDYLKDHYSEKITLSTLGKRFNMNLHHLRSIFVSAVGVTQRKYVEELRINRLKEKLPSGESVTSAVYAVGHNSSSWLYKNSRSRLGMTPSRYRHGSAGEKIWYSTANTEFGIMVVAYTDHGICGVTLVDSEKMIMHYLENEFPKAIITNTADTNCYIQGIMQYLNGHKVGIPLDFHGTDFQMRVWNTLRKIPYGSTVTYSELADMIGEPKAVRAVANACARNPVPLIVPCHRVVRKGGDLGGYGLGIDRKKKILDHEKSVSSEGTDGKQSQG